MPPSPSFLIALPLFLKYFLVALVLLGAFIAVYARITPLNELAEIRANNAAATLSLGGAVLGFVVPLASVIAHSASLVDVVSWGAVALVVQIAAYLGLRLVIGTLAFDIAAGNMAVAGLAGVMSVAVGLLNAACMVP
jgi:putative membrane protein